jgi:hypothetical protein
MKIDEKLVYNEKKQVYANSCSFIFNPSGKPDDDLFFSSIFTLRASRKLSYAALLKARNSALWLRL